MRLWWSLTYVVWAVAWVTPAAFQKPISRRQSSSLPTPGDTHTSRPNSMIRPPAVRFRFSDQRRKTMEAYRIDRFGSVDGIVLRVSEDPCPGPKEVLMRVRASSLNYRCVSAAGRDPTHKPAQVAHSACLFALTAGSRSAPIGTPPSDDSKRRFKQID